jgi:hypothetical protein
MYALHSTILNLIDVMLKRSFALLLCCYVACTAAGNFVVCSPSAEVGIDTC